MKCWVCPFGTFPKFSGFSRCVPFLLDFLGVSTAPTRNSPERVRDTIWTFSEKKSGNPPIWNPPPPFKLLPSFWAPKLLTKLVRKFPENSGPCLAGSELPTHTNNSPTSFSRVKDDPTCYRAPRWLDPEFPRKIPKKYPPTRNSDPKKIPRKIPKKYQRYFFGISGYLGAKIWESRISGRGVFFRYFSWKVRVGPFRGSVAGRGVLNFRVAGITHKTKNN